jgi:hypothetical protein
VGMVAALTLLQNGIPVRIIDKDPVLVFAPSPADAVPILASLESCDKSVVRSAVILPSSAPATHVVSPADLVLLDQEGHAYSAYIVEADQTKVFVIRPDGVIGAIVHGAEGTKKYFSKIYPSLTILVHFKSSKHNSSIPYISTFLAVLTYRKIQMPSRG